MEDDTKNKNSSSSRYRKLRNWFSINKQKEDYKPSSYSFYEIEDGAEDEDDEIDDDYEGNLSLRSVEFDPCILTNKLRVFVGTWNVGGRSPVGSLVSDMEDWLNLKNDADIYVLGFQEIVPLKTLNVLGAEDKAVATRWNNLIATTLNKNNIGSQSSSSLFTPKSSNYNNDDDDDENNKNNNSQKKYMLVASKKMVGVFISVWIRREILRRWRVSSVRVSSVACGVFGYLRNKGSVAVSMAVEGTSLCFVAAHLASGEKKGDEGRRNHQVSEIFKRTCFGDSSRTTKQDHYYSSHHQQQEQEHPLTILGHDRIFWFGDLNYRLYLEDNFARNLIRKQDWKALQEFDQLQKELEEGGVFEGWREGSIEFAPTYKYSSSSINNSYCGGYGGIHTSSGEKQRTPAWCDRILWYGKGVEQLDYIRSEIKFSDHRPVSALFSTHIEITTTTDALLLQQLHQQSCKA